MSLKRIACLDLVKPKHIVILKQLELLPVSSKMTSINLGFYWKMWIGCIGDVNDLLSIKFWLNRQGDSVVSEGRGVGVWQRWDWSKSWFPNPVRITICAWINRLDLSNVDYSASNISGLKGCQMAYMCNRIVVHDFILSLPPKCHIF